MTTTRAKFTVGQVVKHITTSRGDTTIIPATVTKVWRNGVVQIAHYTPGGSGKSGDTGRPFSSTFAADGSVRGIRGSRSWHHTCHIEPLAEGETAERLLAVNEKKAQAARDDAEQAKRQKQQQVAQWWEAQGKAMWDARNRLPQFLGEDVCVIRFTRHGEQYMPFVIVRQEQAYNGPRTVLTTGGLIGRTYDQSEGRTHKSISTYSSSDAYGQTLEEALYEVTH